ncbi:transmembrane protein, putative (macronuclear) [Tetrahymena thermophila SB210]|uniref:Transmembrane protein, putative n=1 Tax=Tetrahymena thermophila (strain SB210) TaxID=312017 RepID=W7XGI6_TETTS|nr:transmembrane protein, putative [Tetrahymena thermophila SB210]EWS73261.1 transmembrane protein, putative [Tetrahymena thermophila SB210]|eukprot:XP_012654170.1 transmembrane protein, putative [Tetrahymena thermophila SB210]
MDEKETQGSQIKDMHNEEGVEVACQSSSYFLNHINLEIRHWNFSQIQRMDEKGDVCDGDHGDGGDAYIFLNVVKKSLNFCQMSQSQIQIYYFFFYLQIYCGYGCYYCSHYYQEIFPFY